MKSISDIIIRRLGRTVTSYMTTTNIVKNIYPNVNYKVLRNNLLDLPDYKLDKPYNYSLSIPKYIDIDNNWDKDSIIMNKDSNILGNFNKFKTSLIIDLPINIATYSNVNYYGSKLFTTNDLIKFNFNYNSLPLTYVSIGKTYVKDYLEVKELGGGQYLEIHDNPHYHSALNQDNSGFIILGKEIDNKIRLSGFIIPWNCGLYTPGNIIHSDGNLVGNWMVCYSKTTNYSTALLRDGNDNCTKINPIY
jgi:hypothetical protein